MIQPPDPVEAWSNISARAARATRYRPDAVPTAGRPWTRLGSLVGMTAALAVIVVGLALRPDSGPAGGPVTAEANDGMFRLELTTPHGSYGPGDAIEPVARVTYLGPDGTITVQHARSQLVFRIQEVGGTREMTGGTRSSCESTNLVNGEPLVVPFAKSGSPDDPSRGFDLAWYQDPVLTLPVGTWRITVDMDFSTGGCGDEPHVLQASNVIQVVAPSPDGPVVDTAEDGVFRLELSTPRRTYAPTDAIEPVATLTYLGPEPRIAIYRAGSLLGFGIAEVGGENRTLYPAFAPACVPDVIVRDTPLTIPYAKSGPIGGAFDRAWFDDPVLRLPVGTWRISVYTTIATDDGPAPSDGSPTCGTRGHSLEVANVITVLGDPAPSPLPSLPTPTPPSPSPSAIADAGPVIGTTEDELFMFDLTTPRGVYGPEEVIEPVATVRYLGSNGETTMYHAASPVGFIIEEIGGDRSMDGFMNDPCLRTAIRADTPLTYPFEKAGTTERGFDAAWYQDPELRLPVGTWRIRAYLDVSVTDGTATCGGPNHYLEVENVITVRDPAR